MPIARKWGCFSLRVEFQRFGGGNLLFNKVCSARCLLVRALNLDFVVKA